MVEGNDAGDVIWVIVQGQLAAPPPAPAKPSTHTPAGPTKEELERQKKRREEEHQRFLEDQERQRKQREDAEARLAKEKCIRVQIIEAILDKIKWPPRREDLLRLIEGEIDNIPEALEEVFQGLEIPQGRGLTRFDFAKLSDTQAAQTLLLVSLAHDFDEYNLGHGCDYLNDAAKAYSVNVAEIRKPAKPTEGGSRKEVIKGLPTLGATPAPKAKAAPPAVPAAAAAKKKPTTPTPKKKTAKPAPPKKKAKGGKK